MTLPAPQPRDVQDVSLVELVGTALSYSPDHAFVLVFHSQLALTTRAPDPPGGPSSIPDLNLEPRALPLRLSQGTPQP